MAFLVWHRLPNYYGGDSIDPRTLEHGEIQFLSDIKNFDFIKFHRDEGYSKIVLVEAEFPTIKLCFDFFIYVENPKNKSRLWVGKLTELGRDK